MVEEYQLHLPFPNMLDDAEDERLIVSSCVVCQKSLKKYEVTLMHDGEHCCLSVKCQDTYVENTPVA